MRYFLIILFSLFSISLSYASDDIMDVDYNFIDTAFDGIKPVSDAQFNNTINRLTPQPVENTFGSKLRTFLFGRKYGTENTANKINQPNTDEEKDKIDIGGEKQAIENLKNGVYYIKLVVSIVDSDKNIIPMGNYKVKQVMIDDNPMLVFYQGYKEYGKLKLQKYDDRLKKENDLTYSRVDIVSDDIVRIVYATIEDTKCAFAKVYLQN